MHKIGTWKLIPYILVTALIINSLLTTAFAVSGEDWENIVISEDNDYFNDSDGEEIPSPAAPMEEDSGNNLNDDLLKEEILEDDEKEPDTAENLLLNMNESSLPDRYDNSISGYIWLDILNNFQMNIQYGNGIIDEGEEGVSGYAVSLFSADDSQRLIQTVYTGFDGIYQFHNITPGTYLIGISNQEIEGIEYLLPLMGITTDNMFNVTADYITVYTNPITVDEDSIIEGINGGVRTPMGIMPTAAANIWSVAGDTTYTSLEAALTAVNSKPDGDYEISVIGTEPERLTGVMTIDNGKNVTLSSNQKIPIVIYPALGGGNERHFNVLGGLTLKNIILDGEEEKGGVSVSGTLTMEENAVIQKCFSPTGGGVFVDSGGQFIMNDGEIRQNEANDGGGLHAKNNSTLEMKNGKITANSTISGSGGGIYTDTVELKITGGEISQNTAFSNGGGICALNSDVTISDAQLIYNTSQDEYNGGGGLYSMYGKLTINDTIIKKNSGIQNGGGMFVTVCEALTITGGEISWNTNERGFGGAFFSNSNELVINDCNINNNTSGSSGGAVFAMGGDFTIDGGTIYKNTSKTGTGGGIHSVGGDGFTFEMVNVEISKNTALSGGGIFAAGGTFTIEDSEFTLNEALNGPGAGIYSQDSFLSITGTTVSENTASQSGGGVFATGGSVTIDDVEFTLNKAEGGEGGAVYSYGGHLSITEGKITLNESGINGGGVLAKEGNFTISGVEITSNKTNGIGGGLYSYGSGGFEFKITDVDIKDNEAGSSGGGVFAEGGKFSINGGIITLNRAEGGEGGGIYSDDSDMTIMGTQIVDNTGKNGGGIYVKSGQFEMIGGVIQKNKTVLGNGGGIFGLADELKITDVEISFNTAFQSGGGVFLNDSTLKYSGGEIFSNEGDFGGAIYLFGESSLEISSGGFKENIARYDGGGIFTSKNVDYSNLNLDASVTFTANESRQTYKPIPDAFAVYGNYIKTQSASKDLEHSVNNDDINILLRDITIHYINRDGTTAAPDESYSKLNNDICVFDPLDILEKTYVGWKQEAAGAFQDKSVPVEINRLTANTELYIVYGQDLGETGETPDKGNPDGIEDIIVTKQFQDINGTPLKEDVKVIVNFGDTFADGPDFIYMYTYQYYKTGAFKSGAGEIPDILVSEGDNDFTVIYVYDIGETFTLTYDTNGGNDDGPQTQRELYAHPAYPLDRTTVPTHDKVNDTEVVFVGWTEVQDTKIYSKSDTLPQTVSFINITGDTTVYALWCYDNPDTVDKSTPGGSSGGRSSSRSSKDNIVKTVVNSGSDKAGDSPVKLLDDYNHFVYLYGYPDKTVQPERPITRAEAAAIFYRLLLVQGTNSSEVFPDVEENQWYTQSVNYLASIGIVNGYNDGMFRPDRPISRAEFATMAAQFDSLAKTNENIFSDVADTHWAVTFINSAFTKGWVNGYPDGTFKPENNITRGEVVTIVNSMLNRKIDEDSLAKVENPYIDITNAHWAYPEVIEASIDHDYARDEEDTEHWNSWILP